MIDIGSPGIALDRSGLTTARAAHLYFIGGSRRNETFQHYPLAVVLLLALTGAGTAGTQQPPAVASPPPRRRHLLQLLWVLLQLLWVLVPPVLRRQWNLLRAAPYHHSAALRVSSVWIPPPYYPYPSEIFLAQFTT